MSIGKAIALATKAAANLQKAAAPAAKAANTATQGAGRTKAFTDKLGRNYANGRATKGAAEALATPAKAVKPAAPATGSPDKHVQALKSASRDSASFDAALKNIKGMPPNELAAVAVAFRGGGPAPKNAAAAIRVIEKRRLELVRNANQIKQAKKARPW